MACIYGSYNGIAGLCENECKLFLTKDQVKHNATVFLLSARFWCSQCDNRVVRNHELSMAVHLPDIQSIECDIDCDFYRIQSLFFELLYDDSSEEVQVACVGIVHKILAHGTKDML